MFQQTLTLSRGQKLSPGQYAFEFSLGLPTNLPSSTSIYQGSVGSTIWYNMSASVKEEGKRTQTVESHFLVCAPAPLDEFFMSAKPKAGTLSFTLTRNKEPVRFSVRLSSLEPPTCGGWVPWNLFLENKSSKKITKVCCWTFCFRWCSCPHNGSPFSGRYLHASRYR